MTDPFALNALASLEPWRLWTGHLAHFGLRHATLNLAALAIPWLLAGGRDRNRMILALLLVAPVLSEGILWQLNGASYRGGSGLACVAWAMVGGLKASKRDSRLVGGLMLMLLAGKIAIERAAGVSLSLPTEDWQTMPAAHTMGAGLGLLSAAVLLAADATRPIDPKEDSSSDLKAIHP